MEELAFKYLAYLRIPFSNSFLKKTIQSHPNYPSLLSVMDGFDQIGVECIAIKIGKNELSSIEFPYMLQAGDKENFKLIKDESDLYSQKKFTQSDSFVVVKVNPENWRINSKHAKQLLDEKANGISLVVSLFSAWVLLLILINRNFSWSNFLLLVSAASGVAAGFFLISKELGVKYPLIEAFCKTKNSDCDSVINSKKLDIFDRVTLSDVVVIYFSFQLIMQIASYSVPAQKDTIIGGLAALAFASLPVVVLSWYYQGLIIKSWCRLCLVVSGVLIFQAAIFFNSNALQTWQFTSYTLFIGISALLLISFLTSLLIIIKSHFGSFLKLNKENIRSLRVRNSHEVFFQLLRQQSFSKMTHLPGEISLGNKDAPLKILMASNLYCNPCKEHHKLIAELFVNNPDRLFVAFRFTVTANEAKQMTTSGQHLLKYWNDHISRSELQDTKTMHLLDDWYDQMDLKKFNTKYYLGKDTSYDSVKFLEDEHRKWFERSGISETPTLFLNGYKLPKEYKLDDLRALIPALADYFSNGDLSVPFDQPSLLAELTAEVDKR